MGNVESVSRVHIPTKTLCDSLWANFVLIWLGNTLSSAMVIYLSISIHVYMYISSCTFLSIYLAYYLSIYQNINVIRIMYIYHHHHPVTPSARISLTLSRHLSLSSITSGRSSGLHPVSTKNCCMYELVALPLLGHVKGSTRIHYLWARPYFSSSVPHVWFVEFW